MEVGTRQTVFFEYPLLMPPLNPHEAKSVAKSFVKLVCEAVEELHAKFQLAHLDLKSGNFCLTDNSDSFGVKLTDLDRSDGVGKRFDYSSLHGESVMYKGKDGWNLGNVDWLQVGIMVHAFLNDIGSDSYHSQEPKANSNFLKQLLDGQYMPELCDAWDPNNDTLLCL